MKQIFSINQSVKAINILPLEGNDIAPQLKYGDIYLIKEIILDRDGNQHLDVGLASTLNFVRSWETKEELDRGNKIHWCHPSRFESVS